MTPQQALDDAIGLCWSEYHRWNHADPKTGEHWKAVANSLELEFFPDRVIERARKTVKSTIEREAELEKRRLPDIRLD